MLKHEKLHNLALTKLLQNLRKTSTPLLAVHVTPNGLLGTKHPFTLNLCKTFTIIFLKESDTEDNKPRIEFPPDDSETEEGTAVPPVEIVTDTPVVAETSSCDDCKYSESNGLRAKL